MAEQLPPHVAAIEPGHVRLAGELGGLLPTLREVRGADAFFRDPQLRVCLRFQADGPGPLENPHLIELLDWLAAEGVAFIEAYDQPYGPAEVMRALQAAGQVRRTFSSLLIRGPSDWELSAHPV